MNKINSKYFFILILAIFISLFIFRNKDANIGVISSDIWLYQYQFIQEYQNHPWSYVPPAYNQEKYYLAYPLLYWLNPGLDHGLTAYFLLAIIIIITTYVLSGLVFKKIFNSWLLATIGGLVVLLPHYICFTNIGLLSFRNLRGLALVFPLYILLSHYWIIYGLKSKKQNILLALLAAISLYLYPPFGILIVPFFILAAFIIYKKQYWRQILMFIGIYLLASSLFWFGHFSNLNSGMLDNDANLTAEQLSLQAQIINYRIPDGSLRGIDFGTVKRTIIDTTPLFILLLLSIFLVKKYQAKLSVQQLTFSRINLWFSLVLILFISLVEIINSYLYFKGLPPVFIEHLRLMRAFGFMWVAQAILVLYILYSLLHKKTLAFIITILLIFGPIYFSAPIIRNVVNSFASTSIRQKYNLAPQLQGSGVNNHFIDLQQAAVWARYNLPKAETKIFVFNYQQEDFQFKILSRHDTNLTVKEGSLWITSGFFNSQKWYQERKMYDQVVNSSKDFSEIIKLAKNFGCNYLLLPRDKYPDLFELQNIDQTDILYTNDNYKILRLL